jgi:hypothetical protein
VRASLARADARANLARSERRRNAAYVSFGSASAMRFTPSSTFFIDVA